MRVLLEDPPTRAKWAVVVVGGVVELVEAVGVVGVVCCGMGWCVVHRVLLRSLVLEIVRLMGAAVVTAAAAAAAAATAAAIVCLHWW